MFSGEVDNGYGCAETRVLTFTMNATQFDVKAAQASIFELAKAGKASQLVNQAEDAYLMVQSFAQGLILD
jgi:hypothetical protein